MCNSKKYDSTFCCRFFLLIFPVLLAGGCTSEIGVTENSPAERRFYDVADFSGYALNTSTFNLLSNFMLHDLYNNKPEQLITALEQLYRKNRDNAVLAALADAALQIGFRLQDDPDQSSKYFLAAAIYSFIYLREFDDEKELYDEQRIRLMRINNQASTELFIYLKSQNLERKSGFELAMPGSSRMINFLAPEYELPVTQDFVADLTPCALFRTENLTHDTRVFGIGVPMVALLREGCRDVGGVLIKDLPVAVTMIADFKTDLQKEKFSCRLRYIYSRTASRVQIGKRSMPLAADFSTPLAKASHISLSKNFLRNTFMVKDAEKFTGLYHFEPYDDRRIPVVFVHGLMSDMRTWSQMLNTLLHDKEIRSKYQFLGFAYSSGNPIFTSGALLRKELVGLRQKLVQQNRPTEAFDKMVLVGHSMGGLLSRMQITHCSGDEVVRHLQIKNMDEIKQKLTGSQIEKVQEIVNFAPSDFIGRVIFIAVPHKGSEIAGSWVGRLGSSLIRLPVELVARSTKLFDTQYNGIDNLQPDDPMLTLLNKLPFASGLPIHSIVGNQQKHHTPGGSDGIVPYWSSHLDNAQSELIVKSGHSVQRNPLAIQEVRRILLLHARGN